LHSLSDQDIQTPQLMINAINDQVISILTLVGFTSYNKNLVLEDAFNQNMLGSFLLVRTIPVIFLIVN
jgi:LAS superfamily LD-carboxypeptidase LdcB